VAVHAWAPPGGDLADRRQPSQYLRQVWARAAGERLGEALGATWGGAPQGLPFQGLVVRGEPGPSLVRVADSVHDLLVVGAGRRGKLARIGHGRLSRHCLAHAPYPVIAIPPASLAQLGGRRLWPPWGEGAMERALSGLDGEKSARNR